MYMSSSHLWLRNLVTFCQNSQVNLWKPRTPRQIDDMVKKLLPVVGNQIEELTITGKYDVNAPLDDVIHSLDSLALSRPFFQDLRLRCPMLTKLVIRRFGISDPLTNVPRTLVTLEFHGCRWSNIYNTSTISTCLFKILNNLHLRVCSCLFLFFGNSGYRIRLIGQRSVWKT